MTDKKVLIYQDYGCSDLSNLEKSLQEYFKPRGIAVEFTDASAIIKDNALTEKVSLFVMPGGAATPYLQKLKILGNEKIRDYIMNGGRYLGICAGAYYACNQVEFETDIEQLAIVRNSELLNLIDVAAIGTLHKELSIRPYMKNEASSAVVRLNWHNDNEIYYAHYHGGPKFVSDNQQFEVLASYTDIEKTPPAIIAKDYGKGRVVLSGVHFEDKGQDLARTLHKLRIDYTDAYNIAARLTENENSRQQLFGKIISELLR